MKDILGNSFPVFQEFIKRIESDDFKFEKQWLYYHDAKAWFCKIQFKKKTVLWLTVWENYFKLSMYFAEKFDQDIKNLNVSEDLKAQYFEVKRIGKIKPVVIDVKNLENLHDAYRIIEYKKSIR